MLAQGLTETVDLLVAPRPGGGEPTGGSLFLGEAGHLCCGVGQVVAGVLVAGYGVGYMFVEAIPFGSAGGSQEVEGPEVAAAVPAAVEVGDGAGMGLFGQAEPGLGLGQLGGALRGPMAPDLEVLLDLAPDRPVDRVGVGGGGHRPFRCPGEGDSDGLVRGAVVDDPAAVVDGPDGCGVPGVGRLASAGLAHVPPVPVQRRRA